MRLMRSRFFSALFARSIGRIFVARQPQRSKTELTNCLDDHRRGSLCERPQQALSISAFCPRRMYSRSISFVNTADGVGWLSTGTAGVRKAAEYHLCKNIRRYVTTTPFSIELFRWRCGHCFVYCLSRCNQTHDALANLHQHVTVFFQIRTSGYWPMAGDYLCLFISPRQNLIKGMNHAID